ncbi:hypothetical protein CPB83DRAFT_858155 [Crepidotus variabilis]|uniref:F-box domain-containing protein n=1 Tax=Crepidotus variabilis TaxID=179855 RepID=A0A9P6EC79_9AGAR|nr:hypothetical protein CPB83DRAFT_858155 [Crepidotus variabilis]
MPLSSLLLLPPELLQEIIANLWNQKKALISCSLTHRTLRSLSQKQLFFRISIEEELELEFTNGTPYLVTNALRSRDGKAFQRLLGIAPHFATYVRALQIKVYGDSVLRILDPMHGARAYEQSIEDEIIKPITFFLPSLVNLVSLTIINRGNWRAFTEKYVSQIRPILQHPSLLFLQLRCTHVLYYLEFVCHSLRYLDLEEANPFPTVSSNIIPPREDSTAKTIPLIYLDLLSLHSHRDVNMFQHHVMENSATQVKISRLKKLSIPLSFETNPHPSRFFSSWRILQECADSLQELDLHVPVESVTTLSQFDVQEVSIDLGQLTKLRKLRFSLRVNSDFTPHEFSDHLCCLGKLLWNSSVPLARLEEINIYLNSLAFCQTFLVNDNAWQETAKFMTTMRLVPSLKTLKFFVPTIVCAAILYNSPATLSLRAAGLHVQVLDIPAYKQDYIYSMLDPRLLYFPREHA